MKILYLTNIPSPYMVDFLNELGKLSDLTAIFERNESGARDKSWKKYNFQTFTGIILKGKKIKVNDELDDQAICPQIVKYIRKRKYDAIVVANPCTPTGIIAIAYMKMLRIPYAIQSEGGFPKDGKGIKEIIKKQIMKDAQLYFSTACLGDQYFLQYGATKEKIRRYPFSSLYKAEIREDVVAESEKRAIREKLRIPYEKVVISVGRFIPVKGFDVYIKACSKLEKNVGVYIIGGTPTDMYLTLKRDLCMDNLHFIEHVDKETMKMYYSAADVFMLNSRGDTWGLVINEAMSYGIPIISSNKCYAALALIQNDINGYIVPMDNIKMFYEKVYYLLSNPLLCQKIGKNNIAKMKEYTLEKMAEREIDVLKELCKDGYQ
ncbi:MAG: glycosyltransferase family 4 protein [Lachnospiraceae bacterium]|nr:glycosyltransferase family 4 protein [Lachnospiraceae bacterium]